MKHEIAIVTFYDDVYREIGELTARGKRDYAKRHGYAFYAHTKALDERYQPPFSAWNKVVAIKKALEAGHRWVFWSDADAAIIAPEIRLESMLDPSKDFLFGCDITGLNTGNFFTQNTHRANDFLNRLLECPDWKQSPGQWEQSRFHQAIKRDWHVFDYALLGDFINAPPSQCGGKFIVHCWGMPYGIRLAHLRFFCMPGLSCMKDNPDLWLWSYFQPRTGRLLEINAKAGEVNPSYRMIGLGWDAWLVPDSLDSHRWLEKRWNAFNVVGVSMNPPPLDMQFDYVHWSEPVNEGIMAWMPWLCGCVVSCNASFEHIFKHLGFSIEIHRTDQLVFLK